MLKRFVRDESGVALGLAIIMVVLIGVMGAGLLVFVNTDLQNVIQVNGGQKAFDTAEAGLKLGKQHLLSNAVKGDYDGTAPDSAWSYAQGGKSVTFDGNTANVQIQYLKPSTSSTTLQNPDYAPEIVPSGKTDYPNGKKYFKVVSLGKVGESRRKVEGIYNTYDTGVPKAYFTQDNIKVSGSACIKNISLFALGDVTLNGNGGGNGNSRSNGDCVNHLRGTDYAYGNWKNSFNPTARHNVSGASVTDAGIGAAGDIDSRTMVSGRDYDKNTSPKFVESITGSGQMTFPFKYKSQQGTADDEQMSFFKSVANEQGNYKEISGTNPSLDLWPDNSTYNTVVYVKLTGRNPGTLKWDVPGDCSSASRKKGILVIENGNFTTQPNQALFSGAVIIRGGSSEPGTYDDTGNTCFEGAVNASGEITISGSVNPSNAPDLSNSPGFYGVKLWSWRELYQ